MNLTKKNFKSTINDDRLVMVDFWASWCQPCVMLAPIVETLAKTNEDIVVRKLDMVAEPELAKEYHVRSIPTLLFFKNGEVVGKIIGLQPQDVIQKHIDELK